MGFPARARASARSRRGAFGGVMLHHSGNPRSDDADLLCRVNSDLRVYVVLPNVQNALASASLCASCARVLFRRRPRCQLRQSAAMLRRAWRRPCFLAIPARRRALRVPAIVVWKRAFRRE
eukprot:7894470-Lingulodinium_polyedra.AAC.2